MGTIEGVVEKCDTSDGVWWTLKLAGQEPVQVHNNRMKELGELKKGDKVRYEESKGPYSNDDALYCVKLERVEK